ncbi:MAG TPA: M48 family metallopeptidase [Candidatus Paceibacterota bacterium]|nr:M48 family metallopeptidase [Candidatus Paceibacterota bacterium]
MRRGTRGHYLANKEAARALVHVRLVHYNRHYGYTLRKVFIKNLRSRWGSASSRGNLNFNYKVVLLPPALQDYVIVHELCHLGEFNHSPKFWALVAQTIPNYKKLRKALRAVR